MVALACGSVLDDCKCGPGLEARETSDGVKCVGILKKIITPCNLPRIPRCVCTGEATSSVNSAKDGSYCLHSEKGVEIKRWDCENKEEWDEYKRGNN